MLFFQQCFILLTLSPLAIRCQNTPVGGTAALNNLVSWRLSFWYQWSSVCRWLGWPRRPRAWRRGWSRPGPRPRPMLPETTALSWTTPSVVALGVVPRHWQVSGHNTLSLSFNIDIDLGSWSEKVDWWRNGATVQATKQFTSSTGLSTTPVAGYYHICAYSRWVPGTSRPCHRSCVLRFQKSGNSNEVCIRKNSGTRIACYGNAVEYDWRSTGVCTNQLLATTDTISLYHESGGSSDCIQVNH